jgi:O-antigen ligase
MERVARLSPIRLVGRGIEFVIDFLRERVAWIVGLGVAYVLGTQIVQPQTRTIKATIGIFLFLLLLLAPTSFGLSFFILMIPFPAHTSYGSTNTMLLFVISIFWLLRASTGEFQVRAKTGYDGFVAAMVIMLCVSLYNAPTAQHVRMGVITLFFYLSAFLLFYLSSNLLPAERDLDRATLALTITTFLIYLTVLVEVFIPNATIIPGWIGVSYTYQTAAGRRMGGVLGGHDTLADWTVLMLPVIFLRLYRSTTMPRRVFYVATLGLAMFSLAATANRGGLVGLVFALGYLLWITRAEFRIVRFTIVGIAMAIALVVFDQYISGSGKGASLIDRILHTEIEQGAVPETREEVWREGWKAFRKHIFIGGGPWFDYKDLKPPHNAFLWSLVCVGILGTIPFALFVLKMVRETARRVRGEFERGTFTSALMTVLHVQMASFAVLQLRTDYQRSPAYVYLMWLLFGMAVVTMRLMDEESAREAEAEETRDAAPARALASRSRP